jgi:hypothetical protein
MSLESNGGYESALKNHYARVRSTLRGPVPPQEIKRMPFAPVRKKTIVYNIGPDPFWLGPIEFHGFSLTEERRRVEITPPPFVETTTKISIRSIIIAAARHYNLSELEIKSVRKQAQLVRARQVAMFVAKMITEASYPFIAKHFGGRDHTTCMHAVNKISQLKDADPQVALDIDAICIAVTGKGLEAK